MFNFTTQTVYNLVKSATVAAKGDRVPTDANLIINKTTKKPSLRIGNTRFDIVDIEDVQVKNPTKENLAAVTFDMSKILIEEGSTDVERTARFVLYVGLSMNSQDSFYSNAYVYKGKPLFVEFAVKAGDTAAAVAKRAQANAKKFLLLTMGPEKILEVTVDGGNVTFTGVNGYQLIKKAILQVFDPAAKTVDCCSTQGEYIDKVTGVPVIYTMAADGTVSLSNPAQKVNEAGEKVNLNSDTEVAIAPGLEAFGDYNWIIHNLRLPTAANTNFWSPSQRMGEMPVPGQQYTQIIVTICKERNGIMGEIVGARGTSVTTHVLYVAGKVSEASAAKTVLDSFKALNGVTAKIKTDADTTLQTPFAGLED